MKISIRHLFIAVAVIVGILLFLEGGNLLVPEQAEVAGLSIIIISFLATAAIPEYLTVLLFFLVAVLFKIAPSNIIFSGFNSTAFWLVFGGLVSGVAINETGLGERLAQKLAMFLNGSYKKLIVSVTFLGVFLDFIMPSAMGRVVLLIPVMLSLSTSFGFQKGSNGRIALILASTLGSYIPAFSILPSNVPNMILTGLAENQHHIAFYYGEYFLLHFPIIGIAKAALVAGIIVWLYPDTPRGSFNSFNSKKTINRKERLLIYTLIVMLLLWMTDCMHHISPAWISLAGAIFLMLPGIEVINKSSFLQKINYGSLFFIAGLVGFGSVINYSGLGTTIGELLIAVLPLNIHAPFVNYLAVSLASTFSGMITTIPGVPALMTPLATDLAHITGFPLKSILMLQVVGFSTVILPYEAPPVVVALLLSNEKVTCILKPLLLIAFVSLLVLLPLDFYWWRLLGWI